MHEIWKDFKGEEFTFEDQLATVLYPTVEPNGKMVLKTEYLDAFPFFEQAMLRRGYHVINITHANRWAPDHTIHQMARFVRAMAEKLNCSEKVIPAGMSCGGLQAARLAQMYPELVPVLYLDAPVLNILSLAGLGDAEFSTGMWNEMVSAYGFNKSTVVAFRGSPIDYLDKLIEHNIPIIMLYGDADVVVPYHENGKVLEDYYKAHGGTLKVIEKSMTGHHPHSLKDPTPIIEFVEQYI